MTRRALRRFAAGFVGCMAGLGGPGAFAQAPPMPTGVESTYETMESPVLKVFSAEEGGHRFVAYLVKWKDVEVIVSDPLAHSHFRVGDNIRFMAQKVRLSSAPKEVATLNFTLIDAVPSARDATGTAARPVATEEDQRQMKIVQGDLNATRNETERFYALNRAARNALKEGQTKRARTLATELARLAPTYRGDWNYGNAIQDANQVLGRIALAEGDLEEAKKRLLASADSKGSPQMNSFGPNMQLAEELLAKGEKAVVLEYFERCSEFWKMGRDRLADWTESVRKDEMPAFGANLEY